MRTLILCIDRDDDLGRKAKVKGPVVGRAANLDAAVKLATADPEDSDANSIFGGIKILDEMNEKGVAAELITLAGDKNVGIISDQKIANQLDALLQQSDFSSAIFISDGAEDESLLSIVRSRIKVDFVKRIVVMQSERLESTYYIIKHALNDQKIFQTFFVPLGLAMLIYAFFLFIDYPQGANIGILATIGLYLVYRGFNDPISVFLERTKESFYSGRISLITYLAAILIMITASVMGLSRVWWYYTRESFWYYGILPLTTVYINATVWPYVAATLVAIAGKVLDCKRHKQPMFKHMIHVFFVVAIGLLFWGASVYLMAISTVIGGSTMDDAVGMQYFVYSIVGAVLIALAGIRLSMGKVEKKKR